MITLKDIANATGCSVSTVSAVLRNKEHCYASKETKERIRETAKKMDYRPNQMSRALRGLSSKTIGIIGNIFSVPVNTRYVSFLSQEIWNAGYQVLMGDTTGNPEKEEELIREFAARGVDGLIIPYGKMPEKKLRQTIPENTPFIQNKQGSYVCIDLEFGMYLAVKHLLELGHKRIVFYASSFITNQEKLAGYHKAMDEAGMPKDERLTIDLKFDEDNGLKKALELAQEKSPTAFVATNDQLAANLIRVFHENSLRIPEDAPVIGYDGIGIGERLFPTLTTVHQPVNILAKETMKALLDEIENGTKATKEIKIPPELIIRNSSGNSIE